MRSSCRIVVIFLVIVSLVSAGQPAQAAVAAATSPPPCPPNSEDALTLTVAARCVAETVMGSRGYIAPCIADPRSLQPNAMYTWGDCKGFGIQGEAIAQARAVRQLNAAGVYGDNSAGGVTPNLQWETAVEGVGRPDLLLYNRSTAGGAVGLVEVKGSWYGGVAAAAAQVRGYVSKWVRTTSGREVREHIFSTPFSDVFRFKFANCKNAPNDWSGYIFQTTSITSTPGVLFVDRTLKKCPDKKTENVDAKSYQGKIGADEDHNGIDDFWDGVLRRPELWLLPSPIPATVPFTPLSQPIAVYLAEDSLVAVEAGIEAGAWNAIVASLPEVAANSASLIAGADAAALGMTEGELLLAESVASAGFVTLPVLLTAAAVAVAVIAVIWLAVHFHVFGDPHIATLDGLDYDFQTVGEFHLLRVPSSGIDVQARYVPLGSSRTVSVLSAMATSVNGRPVEVRDDGSLLVDHEPVPTAQSYVDLGNGGSVMRTTGRTIVTFPGAEVRIVVAGRSLGAVVAKGVHSTGLLGNNDGRPDDDLVTSDGVALSAPPAATLHGRYADSWRLTENESDFAYGEGQTTASYTDRTFPANVVTLGDIPQSDQDIAARTCAASNVPGGPQFQDCILDVAVTGDATYATAAAAVTNFLKDPSSRTVSASGTLTETFDGAIAMNLVPTRTETIGGTGVAGPLFDGSGYKPTVPTLPRHSDATVAFDLIADGLTASNFQGQTTAVNVEGLGRVVVSFTTSGASITSGPGTVTFLSSGTTSTGSGYRRYRFTIRGAHLDSQLRVSIEPAGFRGILGTSLGVDNLSVAMTIVAAESFAATLPLTAAAGKVGGVATVGAATFENGASQDVYSFSVPAGGAPLALSLDACPIRSYVTPTTWTLTTGVGAPVTSGRCGYRELGPLEAGSYRLAVDAAGLAGTYSLAVEAAQPFAATIPLAVTPGTMNGAATAGAGAFASSASQDVYTFTVPAGGRRLSMNLSACPTVSYSTTTAWSITTAAGTLVRKGSCGFYDLGLVPAGSYRLAAAAAGRAGTYSLDLVVAQVFTSALPIAARTDSLNSVATAGAGRFESAASTDTYSFSVPAGGRRLGLTLSACPTANYVTPASWQLLDGTGAKIDDGHCAFNDLGNVAAGSYTLTVKAGGMAGTYKLDLVAAQSFTVALPGIIRQGVVNGAAVAGAGTFETAASQDSYYFSIPAGGRRLGINLAHCPTVAYSTPATWHLYDAAGTKLAYGYCSFTDLGDLGAGSYSVVVKAGGLPGPYELDLAPVDVLTGPLPLAVTPGGINGVAAAGAGTFETTASQDRYTFTVPTGGGALTVNLTGCPSAAYSTPATWVLLTSVGAMLKSGYGGSTSLGTVAAGTYHLLLRAGGLAGTYSVTLN